MPLMLCKPRFQRSWLSKEWRPNAMHWSGRFLWDHSREGPATV